tara:strand:+ start:480 stop:788 length:309 start_codon:yes stop_codon:yes gene_type:complete
MEALALDFLSHGPIGAAVAFLLWMARNHNTRLKAMEKQCDDRHDRQLIEDGKLKTASAKHGQKLDTFAETMKEIAGINKEALKSLQQLEVKMGRVETILEKG